MAIDRIIHLRDIPPEGKDFEFTESSKDLAEIMEGLVGKEPFRLQFTILPIGDGFSMIGKFKARTVADCTRCGAEYELKIEEPINEILVEQEEEPRGSKYAKANHYSDLSNTEGPSICFTRDHILRLEQLLIDWIGLATLNPVRLCGGHTCLKYGDEPIRIGDSEDAHKSPFSILEGLSLKTGKVEA